MQISIAERLRPFSHVPGTSTILPGLGYQIQVFPCLIRIYHLKTSSPILLAELSLELKGPVQQFTVYNDLEKGQISVTGKTSNGWMHYYIIGSKTHEGIRLFVERAPLGGIPIQHGQKFHLLQNKEWLSVLGENASFEPYQIPLCDRLSLGSHKAQDWELIKRRGNLAELFPVWHRLGQLIPAIPTKELKEGTLSLLDACRKSFMDQKSEEAHQSWLNCLYGGFRSLLVPRLDDDDYQGLIASHSLISSETSPLVLLSEGAQLIRRLFFLQENDKIIILPFILPCLPCGRLLNVQLEGGGFLSFEWTKKTIRRMILYVLQDREVTLKFRSHVHSYRLRQHSNERGERKNCQSPLYLQKNCYYFFDNFK